MARGISVFRISSREAVSATSRAYLLGKSIYIIFISIICGFSSGIPRWEVSTIENLGNLGNLGSEDNLEFFKRKLHTFGKKQQLKSE
jgi:hypothetical protein